MVDPDRQIVRAALSLGLIALLALLLLASVHRLTGARIADQESHAQRQVMALVLSPDGYDNDPVADRIAVRAPHWLGSDQALQVRRASLRGQPSALVLEAVAADGYAGPIHLLLAVTADGRISGVRVTAHRETTGLGDSIETAHGPWIRQFDGRSLENPGAAGWRVRRDGGQFDQLAGATITPRAVVAAVHRSLAFVARHGRALHAAPAGSTLEFDDRPEGGAQP